MRARFSAWIGGALIGLVCGAASAAGLQVSPVTLTLQATQQADGLGLSNAGSVPLDAQVRVFRWTQVDGQERLEPTRALIVSPPMLQLPVDGRQLVRVIRSGAPPAGPAEESYRVLVDELPLPQADGQKGLSFVMRHSLPIFLAPAGAPPSPPQLQWTLQRQGDQAVLEVANSGGIHAQLADLVFTDAAGQRTIVHAGLLGYVFPGPTMRWPLKSAAATFTATGQWQVMINGSSAAQNIAPLDRRR